MPTIREFDERMTMNVQSWKKKDLQEIAQEKKLSDSMLLLTIVDEWLERRERENGESASATED